MLGDKSTKNGTLTTTTARHVNRVSRLQLFHGGSFTCRVRSYDVRALREGDNSAPKPRPRPTCAVASRDVPKFTITNRNTFMNNRKYTLITASNQKGLQVWSARTHAVPLSHQQRETRAHNEIQQLFAATVLTRCASPATTTRQQRHSHGYFQHRMSNLKPIGHFFFCRVPQL